MVILLTLLMIWTSAEITFINIRNTVKNELTNVAIRISEDTYKAMREGNLDRYQTTLTGNAAYKAELTSMVKSNITAEMPLTTDSYKIENITLTFTESADSIEYTLTCDIEYYISLFGDSRIIRAEKLELTGRHNIKGY